MEIKLAGLGRTRAQAPSEWRQVVALVAGGWVSGPNAVGVGGHGGAGGDGCRVVLAGLNIN